MSDGELEKLIYMLVACWTPADAFKEILGWRKEQRKKKRKKAGRAEP